MRVPSCFLSLIQIQKQPALYPQASDSLGGFTEDTQVPKCPTAILGAVLVTTVGKAFFSGGLFQLLGLLTFFIDKIQVIMFPALQWCGED